MPGRLTLGAPRTWCSHGVHMVDKEPLRTRSAPRQVNGTKTACLPGLSGVRGVRRDLFCNTRVLLGCQERDQGRYTVNRLRLIPTLSASPTDFNVTESTASATSLRALDCGYFTRQQGAPESLSEELITCPLIRAAEQQQSSHVSRPTYCQHIRRHARKREGQTHRQSERATESVRRAIMSTPSRSDHVS